MNNSYPCIKCGNPTPAEICKNCMINILSVNLCSICKCHKEYHSGMDCWNCFLLGKTSCKWRNKK